MYDYELCIWLSKELEKRNNIKIFEQAEVLSIDEDGFIKLEDNRLHQKNKFDYIINASGPWSEELLKKSNIKSKYSLSLIRGSHLLVNKPIKNSYLLEVPCSKRIFFVLPYKTKTLVGTTEKDHMIGEKIECSKDEEDYLIDSYNYYFKEKLCKDYVTFSGIRPIIKSKKDFTSASREYAIEKNGRIVNVFGGKWTTANSLARKVADIIDVLK